MTPALDPSEQHLRQMLESAIQHSGPTRTAASLTSFLQQVSHHVLGKAAALLSQVWLLLIRCLIPSRSS